MKPNILPTSAAGCEELILNGPMWTFKPLRMPLFGYELDEPGRWKQPNQNHSFIQAALEDPANDWHTSTPVRVPMSWSSALSEPGDAAVMGDFDFPYFWQYVHKGQYERRFDIPASFIGKRVKLKFMSVNFKCWVYVNDKLVTTEEVDQDYTHINKHPFEIDITHLVNVPSTDNRLTVVVQDYTAAFKGEYPNEDYPYDPACGTDYPLGDRCEYYNKDRGWRNLDNGLIGDVLLKSVPALHVKDVYVRTSVTEQTIEADILLQNEGSASRTFHVCATVYEYASEREALPFSNQPEVTLAPGESLALTLSQPWSHPVLWWPHAPFLYQLQLVLKEQDQAFAEHTERFGFRQVEVIKDTDDDVRGFYLNNVRTRLYGESVEPTWKDGYTEGVGTSGLYLYNPEYWSCYIDTAKSLNINVLRTHRGMWVKALFDIADEKGMLMIAESTINNGNHHGAIGTQANQLTAVRDMVTTLRNHPSIIMWSLANESGYDEAWAAEAQAHDSTRPMVVTQATPRYPSPSLAAAGVSYSFGLNGYAPDIYHRHDEHWKPQLIFVYEDNACYDQPAPEERVRAVQQAMTIFRGHRATGYEIINTYYSLQKVFGQQTTPETKRLPLSWTEEDLTQPGYRPDFAIMPLLDPWTDRSHPRVLDPITGYADSPEAYWRRSYAPVAVFDYEYDMRTSIEAADNPYWGKATPIRRLTVHNDDLQDMATEIEVLYEVTAAASGQRIDQGSFTLEVPLGGMRTHTLALHFGDEAAIHVTYKAYKSGVERFTETVYLDSGQQAGITPYQSEPGGNSMEMRLDDEHGYEHNAYYLQFNPWIGLEGNYDIYLHVPEEHVRPGSSQRVEIQHDTINTTLSVDLSGSGWLRLGSAPLPMKPGQFENSIKLVAGSDNGWIAGDAIKLMRMD
ncbi:glycoside hydrolase family 2 protein [Paenibacillus senegalimassiliensis]|uniref:glycoside hydrolase family 2 protein n=1 Tax=Paenibacillus senegalimassiliensis TaxID=1737426 RepID=UPI00073EB782|nr:glycoside hydrolase family 2 [Paenibacillus senegalimassiliensis]